ncbi:MAG: hypothetical protein HQ519_13850 [Planctomycetes bacterium]|nr:hypothetical protein [Planctomycetota bacterium]
MKFLLLLVLLGVAAFCGFGFAATFEPIEQSQQLMWRTTYGIVGLAAIACVTWILVKGGRNRSFKERDK